MSLQLNPDEGQPEGPYETMLASMKGSKKGFGAPKARTDDFTRFTEAKLGKASNALTEHETLGQFLANDGKVLRFFCLWDTRGQIENGERRLYTLNYYLADDTVEVLETKDLAGGRDPWARMLRRSKLPSVKIAIDANGPAKNFPSYDYTALRVGKYLSVFGREFLLYDADRFTKEWYAKKGIDQSGSLDVTEPAPPRPKAVRASPAACCRSRRSAWFRPKDALQERMLTERTTGLVVHNCALTRLCAPRPFLSTLRRSRRTTDTGSSPTARRTA